MNRPYRPVETATSFHLGISVQEHITTEITKKLLDHVVNPHMAPDEILEQLDHVVNPHMAPDEILEQIVSKAIVISEAIISKTK
jgi:hypothetical protein